MGDDVLGGVTLAPDVDVRPRAGRVAGAISGVSAMRAAGPVGSAGTAEVAGAAGHEGGPVGDGGEVGASAQQSVERTPGLRDMTPGPRRKELEE